MANPKVSIIVPVYNVEKYLPECLGSLISQTLKDIEIVCVNDGSSDSSQKIIEKYKKKDPRIILINKKNGGLSSARNAGLRVAKGEYIGFVDSDDWVDPNMFDKMYQRAAKLKADMVMCQVSIFDEKSGGVLKNQGYYSLDCFDSSFDDSTFSHKDTKSILFKIAVTAWNKIYRRSFLEKSKAEFPEGLIFEDNPFFFKTYLKAKKVCLIRESLYCYRINRKESILEAYDRRYLDVIKIQNLCEKVFKDYKIFNFIKGEYLNQKIDVVTAKYFQVERQLQEEFFKAIKNDFKKMNLGEREIELLTSWNKLNYIIFKELTFSSGTTILSEISAIEKRIDRLESYKLELEGQLSEKERVLMGIVGSTSWKVTAPLRKIGRFRAQPKGES